MIWISINDARSLRSWCIKRTVESSLGKDSSVLLLNYDPTNLSSPNPDPNHLKGTYSKSGTHKSKRIATATRGPLAIVDCYLQKPFNGKDDTKVMQRKIDSLKNNEYHDPSTRDTSSTNRDCNRHKAVKIKCSALFRRCELCLQLTHKECKSQYSI